MNLSETPVHNTRLAKKPKFQLRKTIIEKLTIDVRK